MPTERYGREPEVARRSPAVKGQIQSVGCRGTFIHFVDKQGKNAAFVVTSDRQRDPGGEVADYAGRDRGSDFDVVDAEFTEVKDGKK